MQNAPGATGFALRYRVNLAPEIRHEMFERALMMVAGS